MKIKRLKCPVCGHKVSLFWNFFSLAHQTYTCRNCKSNMGWYPIILFYSVLGWLLLFALFAAVVYLIGYPLWAFIFAAIVAQIFFMMIPKNIRLIYINKEEIQDGLEIP